MKWILMAVLIGMVPVLDAQVTSPMPAQAQPKAPELPRFDLDFKGGTPKELVDALNVELKGALNVIIPDEHKNIQIPALKMRQVNVAQVFEALTQASQRTVTYPVGPVTARGYQSRSEGYGFVCRTQPITENSVWAFTVMSGSGPPMEENSVRFYQLGPYLNNLKIDDIITAIQTGWKMLGESPGPNLKFHPETKLLIAVGKASDFGLIEALLKELPKAAEEPKTFQERLKYPEQERLKQTQERNPPAK